MDVAVFHPGTQHSWQTATALQQLDRLAWFATSIFYRPDRFPYRLERYAPGALGRMMHHEFSRFDHPALDPSNVRTAGMLEWLERIAARLKARRVAETFDRWGNARFGRQIGKALTSDAPFHLWGFNSSALTSFEIAKRHSRTCILDRTIGDWRAYNRAVDKICETHADWFPAGLGRIDAAKIALDDREYALADTILCGSEFAAETVRRESPVPGVADKVRVLPYCFDETLFARTTPVAPVPRDGPIRFLFVGLVAPRKGIQHVLEAMDRIPASQAQLTIVGNMDIPTSVFARYADRVTYRSTVPRSHIPQIMAEHHALLFPSYFEGSALSLIEGLASGLALIQTPQSGNGATPDTGIMLDRPDTDLLVEAMLSVIEDRDRLDTMRRNAVGESRKYSFENYRRNIAALLDDLES
ncbi:glycosyltransferase family 4 protein [Croceicoccus sp. YJ47]|uniref:glycosyltransferase family 4 protein n=1 Tax=Croceicoccus sp. YJ47 TaxID=2798724 RepID=UPI0019227B75|nr:glycosyltransferase family 4 protein [Croceicoccus sp. YJ47]QQN72993.1 glycosyltransferase family 4 protein [Croceicoccus sp. YJ47]